MMLEQKFQLARENHAKGLLEKAARGYRNVLERNSNHADALYGLGTLEMRADRLEIAVDLLRRAATIRPEWADVVNALGIALRGLGRAAEAIDCLQRAVTLAPDRPQLLNNYAGTLLANRRYDEAIDVFARSVILKPDDPDVHLNLARSLRSTGRIDEAIISYGRTITLKRDYVVAYLGLGGALIARSRFEEALALGRKACELDPNFAKGHGLRGAALDLLGRRQEALQAYLEAARLQPDDPTFQFHVAALTGDPSVRSAPAALVRLTFDDYATTFDSHLVDVLGYRAPEHLFDAVRAADSRGNLDILDLGCGTGLCGVHFRPIARRLVGVDLSPEMLRRAASRNLYDELIEADVTEALRAQSNPWDVVLAGDVFIYVGDLGELFPAMSAAIRPGGLLAFSLEKFDGEGFRLHERCRFAHSLSYVQQLAKQCSLEEVSVHEFALRRDSGVDVPGLCVLLRKTQ